VYTYWLLEPDALPPASSGCCMVSSSDFSVRMSGIAFWMGESKRMRGDKGSSLQIFGLLGGVKRLWVAWAIRGLGSRKESMVQGEVTVRALGRLDRRGEGCEFAR